MIPKSLSATSLQTFELCPARWKAEVFDRGGKFQGSAANVGITCHNTFEDFVRAVFIRKDHTWDEAYFWELFHKHSDTVLGPDRTTAEYEDARSMAEKWFKNPETRQELEAVQVLSVESKSTFELKTSAGIIPVNYIFDRMDRIGPGEYRVVDYKSQRVALNAAQLRRKLQARLYALMVQIAYKDAQRIWVQFNFLRTGPVEVLFTREDNVKMYRELQRRAEDIINTDENKAPETLNAECNWCVRKVSCKKLTSHIKVGGILSKSVDELAEIHKQIDNQAKAQKILLEEIEEQLMQYAIAENVLEYETEAGTVEVIAKKTRSVDTDIAHAVLTAAGIADQYRKYSVTDLDKILKGNALDEPQKQLLKMAIKQDIKEPTIKVNYSQY